MTLPPIVRVFFAIELPEPFKKKMGDYISALKKKSKPHSIRWTKPENLHITLAFIGETNSQDLDNIITNVKNEIRETAFYLSLERLTFFPSPFRPRVIVLTVQPEKALSALAAQVGLGIQASGYPTEQREFRAHLTLGRIKLPNELNKSFLHWVDMPVIEPLEINHIVLYRSQPDSDSSKYTVLQTFSLI